MNFEPLKLSSFSHRVFTMLATARPDLAALAVNEVGEGGEIFSIKLTSPYQSELAIELSTARDEISLYFGKWHAHYAMFENDDLAEQIAEVIRDIDGLMSGELVILVEVENGRVFSTGIRLKSEAMCTEVSPGSYIISWQGTESLR